MDYSIKPSGDETYVVLTVTGDVTGKRMMGYIMEAHALGNDMGVNRYLVDARQARNIDSTIANYEFAYNDMRHTEGVDVTARVAALVSPGDHSHDFVETVLNNAGLSLQIFNDPEAAIAFLRQ